MAIIATVISLFIVVLTRSGQIREAVTLWKQRDWLISVIKGLALPPWAESLLLIVCAALCLYAIYLLRTRPPIVRENVTQYAVGLRSLDLEFGRIDLDITPQELIGLYQETTGIKTVEFMGDDILDSYTQEAL